MITCVENERLIVHTPAKVNLHLEILGKRDNGYHELETMFAAVSLYDTLEFRDQPSGTSVTCSDARLTGGSDNLVVKAIELMRQASGESRGVAVHLTKRIPMAAGLAGGSSDAAAVILALNRFWQLGWQTDRLIDLAAQLGSDMAFFFKTPLAIGTGRGEQLTQCRLARPLYLVLVFPDVGLSTAEVFRNIKPTHEPRSIEPMATALAAGDLVSVGRLLFNRMQDAAVDLCDPLKELAEQARHWPCLGQLMSGSGTTWFALCESSAKARTLARRIRSSKLGTVFEVHTCS